MAGSLPCNRRAYLMLLGCALMSSVLMVQPAAAAGIPVSASNYTYYEIRITEVYSPEGPRHTVGYPNETGGVLAFSNDVRIGGINGTLVGTMTGECVVGATAAPIANETNYICNEMLTFFAGEYANSSIMISGYTIFSAAPPLTIVGGTNRFKYASGQLVAVANPDDPSGSMAGDDILSFVTHSVYNGTKLI